AKVGEEKVAADGNIITSRGMGTAIEFAMAIAKWLDPQADIDAMEANIMYFK
ncbi:MAG TPA: DJ-1 family protein, partial [Roseburia sp.]|nr:DJ-1 family protein [Roseburia sp.]